MSHPAEEPKQKQPEVKQPDIAAGGKSFRNVDELKSAYEALTKTVGEQGNSIGELRKSLEMAQAEAQAAKVESKEVSRKALGIPENYFESLEQKFFSGEPKAAFEDLFDRVSEVATKKAASHVREAMESERREETLWEKYFAEHEEHRPIARQVRELAYDEVLPKLPASTPLSDRFNLIATTVDRKLEEVISRRKAREVTSDKSSFESGSTGESPAPKPGTKLTSFLDEVYALKPKG